MKADRLPFETMTCQSQVQRPTAAPPRVCLCQLTLAVKSTDAVSLFVSSFVPLLKMTYDDACSRYVELFLEREGSDSLADRLSQQSLLVFLVDDADLLPRTRSRQHSRKTIHHVSNISHQFLARRIGTRLPMLWRGHGTLGCYALCPMWAQGNFPSP